MLPRLHRRHLLEQVLAGEEGHRREEGDHADADAVVAGVRVAGEDAHVLLRRLAVLPALGGYAAEDDYREELRSEM